MRFECSGCSRECELVIEPVFEDQIGQSRPGLCPYSGLPQKWRFVTNVTKNEVKNETKILDVLPLFDIQIRSE